MSYIRVKKYDSDHPVLSSSEIVPQKVELHMFFSLFTHEKKIANQLFSFLNSSIEKNNHEFFSLTVLRLASGITIEVEFSSKNEVEFKLVVFMMKVWRCLRTTHEENW